MNILCTGNKNKPKLSLVIKELNLLFTNSNK